MRLILSDLNYYAGNIRHMAEKIGKETKMKLNEELIELGVNPKRWFANHREGQEVKPPHLKDIDCKGTSYKLGIS